MDRAVGRNDKPSVATLDLAIVRKIPLKMLQNRPVDFGILLLQWRLIIVPRACTRRWPVMARHQFSVLPVRKVLSLSKKPLILKKRKLIRVSPSPPV